MDIPIFFDQQREIHTFLLKILGTENVESDFSNFYNFIDSSKIHKNRDNLKELLLLISKIESNYHYFQDSYLKIDQILQKYKSSIQQTFSNWEIFNIFKRNKRILLILFDNGLIKPDNNINKYIFRKTDSNGTKYRHFFFPEISPFFKKRTYEKVQKELLKIDTQIFDKFYEKRKIGENDSYVCQLIRKDSIEEFVIFTSRTNFPLKSKIKHSIFETKNFLLKQKETTLIEYAAFYGSIQIFQYLMLNEIELKPSLWLYSIHSKSAQLIHILEEKSVRPEDKNYLKCYEEAIKCHDNDMARYIGDNYLDNDYKKSAISFYFHYRNFDHFKLDLSNQNIFFYACKYDYVVLVRNFMKMKSIDINKDAI